MDRTRKLDRERTTLARMVALHCRHHHPAARPGPCPACQELLDYALARLSACPFSARKPVCARCPLHCYKPFRREQIRQVMRHAGPRMLLRHPLLALLHLLDRFRRP